MFEELDALYKNGTWTLVPPVPNSNVVACKWVYRLKADENGKLSRYKARLLAKGFHQQHGVDYHETFSPVIKPTTIQTILSLAVPNQWSLRQLGIQLAFLHGDLAETVYIRQPPGFVDPNQPDHVCLLNKSLYGGHPSWYYSHPGTLNYSVLRTCRALGPKRAIVRKAKTLLITPSITLVHCRYGICLRLKADENGKLSSTKHACLQRVFINNMVLTIMRHSALLSNRLPFRLFSPWLFQISGP
ncbi:hypothetical protein OSB04_016948 [Centaurea solstitialis]|uniref:Reverse transcriptase Ty1/copia-type domain-containing protein n=1 Tax=Centaurea solstitialis TaxID=347529 RepID=A0AA38T9L3_9ASTR|nr:hypothetical protein OSB04_016948 [Centaurea solstitialis]